jgi:hypothetical protein
VTITALCGCEIVVALERSAVVITVATLIGHFIPLLQTASATCGGAREG